MKVLKGLVWLLTLTVILGWVLTSSVSSVEVVMPYIETSHVVIDGVITPKEYTGIYDEVETEIRIYWEQDGTKMYVGLVSPGTGWVGIGLGPYGAGKHEANIIIGAINDITGELVISDSIGEQHQHFSDTTKGGQDNIIEKSGTQSGEGTIIEFSFLLNSGDSFDHNFEVGGSYSFFVAYHESTDDFFAYHTARSDLLTVRISRPNETLEVPELNSPLHAPNLNT